MTRVLEGILLVGGLLFLCGESPAWIPLLGLAFLIAVPYVPTARHRGKSEGS